MATLTIPNTFQLTHEQFAQLARVNRDVRLERTATGELIIMPPTGSITGNRNLDIEGQLWLDFVVELRSPSDNLKPLPEKMQEYLENGTRLGFLIDRQNQTVEIYQPDTEVKILQRPQSLSGEDVLPGFVLDLTEVWK